MDKFGAVSAEFCWEEDREQCCYTGRLDNPSKDDFEKGAVDDFSGFMIGNCDKFHVPYARVGHAKAIHMYWDGWKGEYFEITFQVHFLPFVCNVKYFYCAFFFQGGAAVIRCGERTGRGVFKIDGEDILPLRCWKVL